MCGSTVQSAESPLLRMSAPAARLSYRALHGPELTAASQHSAHLQHENHSGKHKRRAKFLSTLLSANVQVHMYVRQGITANASPSPFSPPRNLVTASINWILSQLMPLKCHLRASASQLKSAPLRKMQHCACGDEGQPCARLCRQAETPPQILGFHPSCARLCRPG